MVVICPQLTWYTTNKLKHDLFKTITTNVTYKITATFTINCTNRVSPITVFVNFKTSFFNSSSPSLRLADQFSPTSSSFTSSCLYQLNEHLRLTWRNHIHGKRKWRALMFFFCSKIFTFAFLCSWQL